MWYECNKILTGKRLEAIKAYKCIELNYIIY
ncbi:Uncharacterised protein [Chryseobacterium gleum]|uniref:Uncharacterized protein n=1 Tax=Chryseobacterium gleum TaxID=250 RepID=A0A448B3F1_CHRGE|nr:Uncharacterised protein [Chryseobacterium gleum]